MPLDLSRAGKLLNRFGRHQRALSTEQFEWFRSELAKHQNQPMMVFGHHPLIVKESPFPITPRNTLDTMQTATVLGDDAKSPGPFLHHAGHTHCNKRTVSPLAPAVTVQEIAAVKEYPGGFSLLRLYTGGFALTFHKTRSALSREWSERSRQEISGAWPQFAFKSSLTDRNMVAKHDLSDL